MTAILEIAFWASLGLLVYSQVGYPLVMLILRRFLGTGATPREFVPEGPDEPPVSLIIAARDEEEVIGDRVANALALEYPREKLELIVASDGSTDRTVERAREAGADQVLDLPPGGKVAAQNAAVDRAQGEILAFSDANSVWQPSALRELMMSFADREIGYVCGRLVLLDPAGDNQEGLYWRYETALRALESALGGITAGNGAIYAIRRDAYIELEPSRSHDGSFPFMLAKRGLRSEYVPWAIARERMLPTIEGEFARKRRIMRPLWDVVVLDGMFWPRGYTPMYAFQIASHRLLRYAAPFLHLVALGTNLAVLGQGTIYTVTLAGQLAVLGAALIAPLVPLAPFRVARYYVSVTASILAGLWDRIRLGPRGTGWDTAESAR